MFDQQSRPTRRMALAGLAAGALAATTFQFKDSIFGKPPSPCAETANKLRETLKNFGKCVYEDYKPGAKTTVGFLKCWHGDRKAIPKFTEEDFKLFCQHQQNCFDSVKNVDRSFRSVRNFSVFLENTRVDSASLKTPDMRIELDLADAANKLRERAAKGDLKALRDFRIMYDFDAPEPHLKEIISRSASIRMGIISYIGSRADIIKCTAPDGHQILREDSRIKEWKLSSADIKKIIEDDFQVTHAHIARQIDELPEGSVAVILMGGEHSEYGYQMPIASMRFKLESMLFEKCVKPIHLQTWEPNGYELGALTLTK